jgi:hypothetical protein
MFGKWLRSPRDGSSQADDIAISKVRWQRIPPLIICRFIHPFSIVQES